MNEFKIQQRMCQVILTYALIGMIHQYAEVAANIGIAKVVIAKIFVAVSGVPFPICMIVDVSTATPCGSSPTVI